MRIYIPLLFVLSGFTGSTPSDTPLMPLKAGNVWSYVLINDQTRSTDSIVYRITSDTLINDTLYHIFEKLFHGRPSLKVFLRNDRGRVYFKRKPISTENIYLPSVHDTVGFIYHLTEIADPLTNEIISLNDSIQTPAGKFDSLVAFECTNDLNGHTVTYYFDKSVGLIAMKSSGRLIAYLISWKIE